MAKKKSELRSWHLYIIQAQDGTLYTGITTDIDRRFEQHLSGKGAKYFRKSLPEKVIYRESGLTRGEALKREATIKKMSREQKKELIFS